MTEKRPRYPQVEGSATIVFDKRKLTVQFKGRTVALVARGSDLGSTLHRIGIKTSRLGEARKVSKVLSAIGVTVTLEDEKGTVLSMGKGVWSPFGHFTFKPRIRKYIGKT